MKLSDAILSGSTVLAPQGGSQYSAENKAGCALGMAAVANGCTFHKVSHVNPLERRTLGVEGIWGAWVLALVKRPCKCFFLIVPRQMRVKDVIAHLFDWHITIKNDWTLEQLVGWVKTVEPSEPTSSLRPQALQKTPLSSDRSEASPREVLEWTHIVRAFEEKRAPKSQRHQPGPRD
jgi:hypothetical protein